MDIGTDETVPLGLECPSDIQLCSVGSFLSRVLEEKNMLLKRESIGFQALTFMR